MKIYFVRHGESTANLLREFSNSDSKHPLTETGLRQAYIVAHALSGLSIEQIYSSPILRALQTAQILAESLGIPIHTTEALREWSVGVYEGTTDPAGWELHRWVQEQWFRHEEFNSRMPSGESHYDIRSRFLPFIQELIAGNQQNDRNILLVGHGGLYLAMLPFVCTNISFAFAQQHGFPYTGYALAEVRQNELHCISWCGTETDA